MNTDHTATLICRGIGVLLLILGFSAILPTLIFGIRSGRVFYAPIGRDEITWLQALLFFVRISFPALTQMLAGILLLVFSRALGHFLATGLSGPVA